MFFWFKKKKKLNHPVRQSNRRFNQFDYDSTLNQQINWTELEP